MNEIIQGFAGQIQAGNFSLLLVLASFLGGIIASLSPCTLGILPIIIGYVGGYTKEKNAATFLQLLSFVLGLSVILTIIGIFCALTGRVFMAIGGQYWVLFMASLILIFGLNLLGAVEIPVPNFIKQMPKSQGASIFFYPFILGVLFALAATPCSTPILAAILSFATLSKDIAYASVLLLAFSLGQGVIIILAGLFTSFVKNAKGAFKFSEILMKICGALLILSAIFLYWKVFSPFFKLA